MKYRYTILEISENGEVGFKAIIPAFPRLFVVADSPQELHCAVRCAIDEEIIELKNQGSSIPKEDNYDHNNYSGSFVLRIKPELHRKIAENAKANGYSLNKYISSLVENYG